MQLVVVVTAVSAFSTDSIHRRISSSSSRRSISSEAFDSSVTELSIPLQTEQPPLESLISSLPLKTRRPRVAVLVCPAQFCVPADYQDLFDQLAQFSREQGEDHQVPEIITSNCRVAPLPRTEWIKVAQHLPTQSFWEATLPVHKTLSWYFDAMETALAELLARDDSITNICIVGHSIGGWVARGYLSGLSRSSSAVHRIVQERCTSLITLGTPHSSPDDALVDQTRGLLREIENSPSSSSQALADRGIDVTCVCSSSVVGSFLSTDVEKLVAASSYLPLLGRKWNGDVKGDGIVPLDLAFLDPPARRVVVDTCPLTGAAVRHSHVVPTPWNLIDGSAPSIKLPSDFVSYTSKGVVPLWAKYIR